MRGRESLGRQGTPSREGGSNDQWTRMWLLCRKWLDVRLGKLSVPFQPLLQKPGPGPQV